MKKTALILVCAGALVLAGAGITLANSPVILAGAGRTDTQTEEDVPAETGAAGGETAGTEDAGPAADAEDGSGAAAAAASGFVCVCGQILEKDAESVTLDNVSSQFAPGEVIVTVDPAQTVIVNSEDGWPADLDAFSAGDFVYAYIGDTMTLSLPPIVNANVLLTQPPQDSRAAVYGRVQAVQETEDGGRQVTLAGGETFFLPADCEIRPYLTRNIVTLEDLSAGRELLLWADENNQASRVILFAE